MKLKIVSLVLGLAALALAAPVKAQPAKPYPITLVTTNATKLTNAVAGTSTNYFLSSTTNGITIGCSEYNTVGISLTSALQASSANATSVYYFYKSYDGGRTYETTAQPTNIINFTHNGTNVITVCANLDTLNATHISMRQLVNTNATGETNMGHYWNLKSPKYGSKVATQ